MRLDLARLSPSALHCALAASLLSLSLSIAPPALADGKAEFKIQGGGASTLQSGRRITITRGVNLDNTDWQGENLKGVAFQQSVVRSANFERANLFTASFFDADLSNSNFKVKIAAASAHAASSSNARTASLRSPPSCPAGCQHGPM
eukprot:scaffold288593_cov32-Tisochrysis_lutea.AAC.1